MVVLKWIGWGYIAAAGLVAALALNDGDVVMFAGAVAGALFGVVLLALERIVAALEEIRDNLRPDVEEAVEAPPQGFRPGRSMAEIEAGITAAKQRAGVS